MAPCGLLDWAGANGEIQTTTSSRFASQTNFSFGEHPSPRVSTAALTLHTYSPFTRVFDVDGCK